MAGCARREAVLQALDTFDGVMIGREAYHRPELLAELHAALHPQDRLRRPDAGQVLEAMRDYALRETGRGHAAECHHPPHAGPARRHGRAPRHCARCCRRRSSRALPSTKFSAGPWPWPRELPEHRLCRRKWLVFHNVMPQSCELVHTFRAAWALISSWRSCSPTSSGRPASTRCWATSAPARSLPCAST